MSKTVAKASKPNIMLAFDADDTLWHNETFYQQAGEKFKQLLTSYQDPGLLVEKFAEIEIRNLQWYGFGIKGHTLSMIETAIAVSAGRVTGDEIQAILELGREMLNSDVLLFEHTAAVLTNLQRDFDLMLITKGDLLEQNNKIARSGLAHLFKHIEIVHDKTAESYRQLLNRYNIPASRFVMVGNSLKSDILPVIEAGGQAVYIPYQHTWAHEQIDVQHQSYYQLEHLGQLPEFIARMEALWQPV